MPQSSARDRVIPQNWPWDPVRLVLGEPYSFYDVNRSDIYFRTSQYEIVAGQWTVFAGYVWDGATWVPDGDPDPDNPKYPKTWKATLVHDIGYAGIEKFGKTFPYSRRQIDDLFYSKLKEAKFKQAKLYYWGVRKFGKYFIRGAKLHHTIANTIT